MKFRSLVLAVLYCIFLAIGIGSSAKAQVSQAPDDKYVGLVLWNTAKGSVSGSCVAIDSIDFGLKSQTQGRYLATAAHVVRTINQKVGVEIQDQRFEALVVLVDKRHDFALLKTPQGVNLEYVHSVRSRIGDEVWAIGVRPVIKEGKILTTKVILIPGRNGIQKRITQYDDLGKYNSTISGVRFTGSDILHGMSGGGVFATSGKLVGIICSTTNEGGGYYMPVYPYNSG